MGFRTLEEFLEDFSDAVRIDYAPSGEMVCYGVTTSETSHLSQLIQKQKPNSRRGSKTVGIRPISSNYQGFKTASAKKRLDRIKEIKENDKREAIKRQEAQRQAYRNRSRL